MFINPFVQIFCVTDVEFAIVKTEEDIDTVKIVFHADATSDVAKILYIAADASNASVVFLGKTELDSVTPHRPKVPQSGRIVAHNLQHNPCAILDSVVERAASE